MALCCTHLGQSLRCRAGSAYIAGPLTINGGRVISKNSYARVHGGALASSFLSDRPHRHHFQLGKRVRHLTKTVATAWTSIRSPFILVFGSSLKAFQEDVVFRNVAGGIYAKVISAHSGSLEVQDCLAQISGGAGFSTPADSSS